MEQGENENSLAGGSQTPITNTMTLAQAVAMGEYNPEYLATFAEWHNFSKHTQLQYIRTAIENRRRQLLTQWAEIDRAIDFRLKPGLHEAQKNIEKQMKKLSEDKERLYIEYSGI